MELRKLCLTSAILIMLSACGGGSSTSTEDNSQSSPDVCGSHTLTSGQVCISVDNRDALAYYPTQQPKGIAVFLHGAPGQPSKVMDIFGAKKIAEQYDFISVAPYGSNTIWGWDSNMTAATSDISIDSVYLQNLLMHIEANEQVSALPVYVFGYSAGGFMNYRLACEMPEQLSAVISLAGQFRGDLEACTTNSTVKIHHFHSTSDTDVPYAGRELGSIESVDNTLAHWQTINGCDQTLTEVTDIGVTATSQGTTTQVYGGCEQSTRLSIFNDVDHEDSYLSDNLLNILSYLFESE